MDEGERGRIKNRSRATQMKDFQGLKYGRITPTDIDLFIDLKNRLFIFAETKLSGTPIHYGQKLALKRLVDACAGDSRHAALFICEHDAFDCDESISVAKSRVLLSYYDGCWYTHDETETLDESIEMLIEYTGVRTWLT